MSLRVISLDADDYGSSGNEHGIVLDFVDRIITIELFGRTYSFKADAEVAQIEKIVRYVVNEVEKATKSGEMPSRLDSVILAALNIASDYFDAKTAQDTLVEDIDRRSLALIEYMDKHS